MLKHNWRFTVLKNKSWLPHLTNEMMIGARNNNLCSYLVALEGWRRGLTLKWYSEKVKKRGVHAPGRLFSLSSDNETRMFYKSKGDKVSNESLRITGNKDLAKKWLSNHNVPVPEGKRFTKDDQNNEIIQYAKEVGFPIVLKPTNGYQGIGVIANIESVEYLEKSLVHVRSDLDYPDVIVERYVAGEEYRVFVVEDIVIAAINRIPANVIGDGINTVEKLITMKNKERRKNPRLFSCLIKIDYEVKNFIKRAGLTLDSIPNKGQQIFLREKSNISTGGDSVDVRDELPVEIKKVAIEALKAMPSLPHAGVDIIVNPNQPVDKAAVVLEINAIPQIGSLVFPMIGQARDVPSAIIDYYFPETKEKKNYNDRVYFDFKGILEPLMSKSASEVTVSPPPLTHTFAKKYVIIGKVQNVRYRRWIRKKALEADLYGYAQNLKDGSVAVVVAGEEETVNKFKEICEQGSKASEVSGVTESVWNNPIKVGFEIKGDSKMKKKSPITQPQNKKKPTLIQRIKKYV